MYAKIYRSLWDGSLAEHWQAWAVFVCMLAHADPDGNLDMTPEAISRRSCIPLKIVKDAIQFLGSPDPTSRNQADEGRRIVPIDAHRSWGWHIVNHGLYKSLKDADMVRHQTRERVRNHREKRSVTLGNAQKRHTDTDTDTDTRESKDIEHSVLAPPSILTNGKAKPNGALREKSTSLSAEDQAWSVQFDDWWEFYPRKEGRKPARQIWMNLPKRERDFKKLYDALMADSESEQWTDAEFVPHAKTWLRQERFNDERN